MATKQKSTRFAPKLKIKTGDMVMIITGKDKGKTGKVMEVFPKENRAIVEDRNMVKKHLKPTNANPQGGIIDKPASIHLSNLKLIDPKTGVPTRVGRQVLDGKIVRYSKKSGEILN
jgi:large subunit ribosomal protein L24